MSLKNENVVSYKQLKPQDSCVMKQRDQSLKILKKGYIIFEALKEGSVVEIGYKG